MLLKNEFSFQKKSKIKAGEGKKEGRYPFFTSSDTKVLFIDNYLFDDEAVILGTGGMPSCNYYNGKFAVSTDNFVLTSKGKIRTKVLYYFFRNNNLSILAQGFHGAGLKHIGKDYIENIEIPYISDVNQKKLISELDGISASIDRIDVQLSKYDEMVKSRFIEMFGNIVRNDRRWKIQPFKTLCREIGDGLHGTPIYDECGEYYFINGNNLENKMICIKEDTKKVSKEESKKYFIEMDSNTVLISINGTFGKTGFYNGEKVILGKSACFIKLGPNLNKEFVINLFGTEDWMQYMDENSSGTTIKNFGLKAMREFQMVVPPIKLQEEFAEYVTLIDKSKFILQEQKKHLEELYESKLHEYFGD